MSLQNKLIDNFRTRNLFALSSYLLLCRSKLYTNGILRKMSWKCYQAYHDCVIHHNDYSVTLVVFLARTMVIRSFVLIGTFKISSWCQSIYLFIISVKRYLTSSRPVRVVNRCVGKGCFIKRLRMSVCKYSNVQCRFIMILRICLRSKCTVSSVPL